MKMTTASCSLAVMLLGLAHAASAADKTLIYKSIDANGTTVFTDQPAPEATIVKPPPLNVVDQPTAGRPSANVTPSASAADSTTVDSVSIITPANEQIFTDPQSPLWVEFELSPARTLPVGLSARVLMDGKVISTGSGNRLPIDIPERGTHGIQLQVVDPDGDIQAESRVIDIHVRHHIAGSSN